jgi:hypothetical protein
MNLRNQAIERPDVVTMFQQLVGDMRANKSCTAGDQNGFV